MVASSSHDGASASAITSPAHIHTNRDTSTLRQRDGGTEQPVSGTASMCHDNKKDAPLSRNEAKAVCQRKTSPLNAAAHTAYPSGRSKCTFEAGMATLQDEPSPVDAGGGMGYKAVAP